MLQLFKGHRHMSHVQHVHVHVHVHVHTQWHHLLVQYGQERYSGAWTAGGSGALSHYPHTFGSTRPVTTAAGSTRGPTRIPFCHPRLLGPTTRPPKPRRASPLAPPVPPTTIDVMGTGLSTSPSASTVAGGILRPGSQPHVRPPRGSAGHLDLDGLFLPVV